MERRMPNGLAAQKIAVRGAWAMRRTETESGENPAFCRRGYRKDCMRFSIVFKIVTAFLAVGRAAAGNRFEPCR
jgi:hypothetical protein